MKIESRDSIILTKELSQLTAISELVATLPTGKKLLIYANREFEFEVLRKSLLGASGKTITIVSPKTPRRRFEEYQFDYLISTSSEDFLPSSLPFPRDIEILKKLKKLNQELVWFAVMRTLPNFRLTEALNYFGFEDYATQSLGSEFPKLGEIETKPLSDGELGYKGRAYDHLKALKIEIFKANKEKRRLVIVGSNDRQVVGSALRMLGGHVKLDNMGIPEIDFKLFEMGESARRFFLIHESQLPLIRSESERRIENADSYVLFLSSKYGYENSNLKPDKVIYLMDQLYFSHLCADLLKMGTTEKTSVSLFLPEAEQIPRSCAASIDYRKLSTARLEKFFFGSAIIEVSSRLKKKFDYSKSDTIYLDLEEFVANFILETASAGIAVAKIIEVLEAYGCLYREGLKIWLKKKLVLANKWPAFLKLIFGQRKKEDLVRALAGSRRIEPREWFFKYLTAKNFDELNLNLAEYANFDENSLREFLQRFATSSVKLTDLLGEFGWKTPKNEDLSKGVFIYTTQEMYRASLRLGWIDEVLVGKKVVRPRLTNAGVLKLEDLSPEEQMIDFNAIPITLNSFLGKRMLVNFLARHTEFNLLPNDEQAEDFLTDVIIELKSAKRSRRITGSNIVKRFFLKKKDQELINSQDVKDFFNYLHDN